MRLSFVPGPVRVRVPATSANLGPGFDAFGLALALYDEVSAEIGGTGYRVRVTGEGAGLLPTDGSHLVVRAMRATFDRMGGQPDGLVLDCRNVIPQARGLGSSSAAIVAGVSLARALVVDGAQRLDDGAMLELAAELEGHPDNVAACLLGGFTIAWAADTGTRPAGRAAYAVGAAAPAAGLLAHASDRAVGAVGAVSLPVDSSVHPTVFVPAEHGFTESARRALPATVPHRDAAFNAGRAGLLVHALTIDPGLLFAATEDRLHQSYRAGEMPAAAALLAKLRGAGVAAVVSGAGPTILALTSPAADFEPGMDWAVQRLPVDVAGIQVERGRMGHAERDPVAAGRKS